MVSAEQLLRALLHAQLHGRAVEMLQGLCQPGASAPSDQVFNSMLDSTVSWQKMLAATQNPTHTLSHVITGPMLSAINYMLSFGFRGAVLLTVFFHV